MKKYIEQNGITYELRGEQYYPLLELPEQKEIGKYGRLHLEYLKAHRKSRYTNFLSEGTLNQRLYEIDVEAKAMVEHIIHHLPQNDFFRACLDVVHLSYPTEHIVSFQILVNTSFSGESGYDAFKHRFCFKVDFAKVLI